MKKQLLYLIIPTIFYADSLNQLLEYTNNSNMLIKAKELTVKSKQKEIESSKSSYFPTLDIGGSYQRFDEKTPNLAGDISNGYAKISFNIYNGGKDSSIVKQKKDELKITQFDKLAFQKSLNLQIIQEFFTIKNIDSSLLALEKKAKSLKAQLKRVEKFYDAKLSSKDEIDKLQSYYDTNNYNIQSLKFKRLSVIKSLELKVGKNISMLDDSKFIKQSDLVLVIDESIKSLKAKDSSLKNLANSIGSAYKPQINISDTYNIYDYGRTDNLHSAGLDNQNKIMLSVNLRLFDGGAISKNKQAIMINSQSLKSQIDYKIKEQKMLFDLSKSRISTSNLKIKSSLSALISAKSTYKIIDEKYKAGIVDNIAYLDALSIRTNAFSLYQKSLNDLEVAYAIYYFYSGKNIRNYIKKKEIK